MLYKQLSIDDKFIFRVKNNENPFPDLLFKEMEDFLKTTIKKTVNLYPICSNYKDELYSIGLEVMGICLDKYVPGNNNFMHYYRKSCALTIYCEGIKATKLFRKTKYITDDHPGYMEVQLGQDDEKITGDIDAKDTSYKIAEYSKCMMSAEERKVLQCKLKGKSVQETAEEINKDEKHVYYVLNKVKKHVKKATNPKKVLK